MDRLVFVSPYFFCPRPGYQHLQLKYILFNLKKNSGQFIPWTLPCSTPVLQDHVYCSTGLAQGRVHGQVTEPKCDSDSRLEATGDRTSHQSPDYGLIAIYSLYSGLAGG